jgi:hypothetical protein
MHRGLLPFISFIIQSQADENLAKVVSKVADLPFSVVYNDMLKSVTVQKPSSDELERVKNILLQFGFEQWENKSEDCVKGQFFDTKQQIRIMKQVKNTGVADIRCFFYFLLNENKFLYNQKIR